MAANFLWSYNKKQRASEMFNGAFYENNKAGIQIKFTFQFINS